MKLGDNKGKKIARPIFDKISHFGQFWPNVPKNGQFGPKSQFFGICEKTAPPKFLYFDAKSVILDWGGRG